MTSKNLIYGLDNQMNKILKYCKWFLGNDSDFVDVRDKLSITPTFLFHGFPGTGKTTVANVIYKELKKDFNIDLEILRIEELLSSNFGESSKNILDFFAKIELNMEENKSFTFVIIDELDSFTINRYQNDNESIKRVLLTFNKIIDEMFMKGTLNKTILVATTNVRENIDTSVLRRFFFHENFNITLSKSQFFEYIDELKAVSKSFEFITDIDKEELYKIYNSKKFTLGEIKSIFACIYMDIISNQKDKNMFLKEFIKKESFYEILTNQQS